MERSLAKPGLGFYIDRLRITNLLSKVRLNLT